MVDSNFLALFSQLVAYFLQGCWYREKDVCVVANAIDCKGTKVYGDEEKLKEIPGSVDQFVAKNLFDQLEHLESLKEKYLESFKANMKKHPALRRLDGVPGIDVVRAHVIAC